MNNKRTLLAALGFSFSLLTGCAGAATPNEADDVNVAATDTVVRPQQINESGTKACRALAQETWNFGSDDIMVSCMNAATHDVYGGNPSREGMQCYVGAESAFITKYVKACTLSND